ncbi:lysophospholipid acyltransferase family protein [bacterium]|nr:lysophospholipid acyltransferase family protein [bacterium]MCI0605816.1 lysophospholipid acyltransferase family protein [bacterium]
MKENRLPTQPNAAMRLAGAVILKLSGWKIEGNFPDLPKAVVIAAPHTSNWDFIIGIAAKSKLQLKIHWLGKHTLFRKPFDRFFRWLGGTPVERNSSQGIVEQTIELFRSQEQFLLGLSPEGTRKKVDRWKTGFYQIAKGAGVPIIPVAFDYSKKIVLIGKPLEASGSTEEDFQRLRAFYADVKGKIPQNFNANFS